MAPNALFKATFEENDYFKVLCEELSALGEKRQIVLTVMPPIDPKDDPWPQYAAQPTYHSQDRVESTPKEAPRKPEVTDPELLLLAARIAEQERLYDGRSILIRNKIADLRDQYLVREQALASLEALRRPRRDSS